MMKSKIAKLLFFINALLHVFCIVNGSTFSFEKSSISFTEIIYLITRLLLMPTLAYYAFTSFYNKSNNYLKFIFISLFFSWLGDVLLTFKTPLLFLLGIAAFLTAHVFYIIVYNKESNFSNYYIVKRKPFIMLPYLLVVAVFLWLCFEKLQLFIFPVAIYSFVLSAMSIMALNRFNNVSNASFMITYIGSLLFMFSDLMIGWNTFYKPLPWASLIIMTTYIAGQFLIIEGLIYNTSKNR